MNAMNAMNAIVEQPQDAAQRHSGTPPNIRNHICVTNFVIASRCPDVVKLTEHLYPLEGIVGACASIRWGVYGRDAHDHGSFLAHEHGRRQKESIFTIRHWYLLPNLDLAKGYVDEIQSRECEFFHVGRIKSSFRQRLERMARKWAESHLHPASRVLTSGMRLDDFVARHPRFVHHLLSQMPECRMIVHPAIPSYAGGSQGYIWVATHRADRERITKTEVLFRPDVDVEL